jgi:hypothetical protein
MKRSRVFKLLAAGTVGAALLVGGFVIASNIGVKLIYPLVYSGSLLANDFQVSVPFSTPLQTANDLFQAAPGATQVAKLNAATNTVVIWFPGFFGNNFPIVAPEGYLVRIPQFGNTSVTFVGAHNPSIVYNYNVANADFLVSIPYHTTWKKANDIFQATPNALSVSQLNPATNTAKVWFPGFFGNNFDVVIGEGYRVRVGSSPSVSVPEHF